MKRLSILAGTTVSLIACAVAIAPANANSIGEQVNLHARKEIREGQQFTGKIVSIVGDLVAVEFEDTDETVWIGVSQVDLRRWSLVEGMYVSLVATGRLYRITGIASESIIVQQSRATGRTAAAWRQIGQGRRTQVTIPRRSTTTQRRTTRQRTQQFVPAPAQSQPIRGLW